ncbi:MAG: FxsA family protein [Cocleimonas sp.]
MRSFPIFFVLFLVVPIIEIFFLIKVGEVIGVWWTILLVVLTAVIGAGLLRQQGLSTLARFQKNMGQGKLPAQEMVEGILLAVGGALLMTPGFVTDTFGFLCLLPFTRKFIAANIIKRSAVSMSARMGGFSQGGSSAPFGSDSNIYEGEFTEVNEDPIVISSKDSTNRK